MISPMLLLLAQAASPSSSTRNDIVVTGRRAEQNLAECVALDCPPAKDIEMSLQASVEQFADGRYADARSTLLKAIQRNRDHAADLPRPVSSLHATLATVAEHMGDTTLWLESARNNVNLLRRYLGETNVATLKQELSLGDDMVGMGKPSMAFSTYHNIQRKAAEAGHSDIAAGAAFRRAWLALTLRRDREAKQFADEAVALAGVNARLMVDLRDILRTRIAIRHGEQGAADALAEKLRQSPDKAPTLIFAPPINDVNQVSQGIEADLWHDSEIRLADVGFWIRPDGRTSDIEILRNSGLGQWRPGVLRQIKERRYVPFDAEPGYPGNYRVERFTIRAEDGVPTGSHIKRRIGKLTVHVIDLTETDAITAAHRERARQALVSPDA